MLLFNGGGRSKLLSNSPTLLPPLVLLLPMDSMDSPRQEEVEHACWIARGTAGVG